MNDNAEQQPLIAGRSYPEGQLAKAFVTALTHENAGTRRRAEVRGQRWQEVLAAIASGRLAVGSRTPVAGLPSWVTPEVMRGGFATGTASAGGPLQAHETAAARSFGVPAERRALFAFCLTEPGLAWLWTRLDSGRYEIGVPEEAALLTMAWLVSHGRTSTALDLVAELEPFADRLRFLPRPADGPSPEATAAVHRHTVSDAVDTLMRRRPNAAVDTQREALTVWQPFGDELLAHWLRTERDGQVLGLVPDADWRAQGEVLLGGTDCSPRNTPCAPNTATPRRTWAFCEGRWRRPSPGGRWRRAGSVCCGTRCSPWCGGAVCPARPRTWRCAGARPSRRSSLPITPWPS